MMLAGVLDTKVEVGEEVLLLILHILILLPHLLLLLLQLLHLKLIFLHMIKHIFKEKTHCRFIDLFKLVWV